VNKDVISVTFVPLFLLLIVYPLVALIANIDMEGIIKTFRDEYFWYSVKHTILAALIAASLGVLMAVGFGYYHLFRRGSFFYRVANLLNDLPIALPHTVAGLALLIAFGRKTFGFVSDTGLAFNLFAVAIAMFFGSFPLASRTLASGVDRMEQEIVDVARTLGDTPSKVYLRVVLPMMGEALFSAFVLSFSRSLGEFGAVVIFGGNLPASTQVLASYVFSKVEEGELEMAVTASVFCIILSLAVVGMLSITRFRRA